MKQRTAAHLSSTPCHKRGACQALATDPKKILVNGVWKKAQGARVEKEINWLVARG